MGGVIGNPRTFYQRFRFLVEIDGVGSAKFEKCDGLGVEVAETDYHEGGAVTPDKQPARVTFGDITLERGATSDTDMYDWLLEVIDASAGTGIETPGCKRNLDIVQLGRDGSEKMRWRVYGAWVKGFKPGTWDNESDDNLIETSVLAIDRFERVAA